MRRKVLVVDDVADNRELLTKILNKDYEILSAENGKAALDILDSDYESISAVLLDIIMPIMDGFDLLKAIRADERFAQIAVIITTGSNVSGGEVKALDLGADDFVVKPYHPGIIKQRLFNIINLREKTAQVDAAKTDKLTGLFSRSAFFEKVSELTGQHEPGF